MGDINFDIETGITRQEDFSINTMYNNRLQHCVRHDQRILHHTASHSSALSFKFT